MGTGNCGLNILHQNVQCISNKLCQLDILVEALNINLLVVSEHWLNQAQLDTCRIQNMDLLSSFCRKNSKHGGVAIYGLSGGGFQYKSLDILNVMSIEM